jgi:hypothetical protein
MVNEELYENNLKYIDNLQQYLFTDWKLKNEKINKILTTGNYNSKIKVPWYIILPYQRSKRIWDILICLCCIISLSLVTIDLSWNIECMTINKGTQFFSIYYILTVFFYIDIFASFFTAKLDEMNTFVFGLKSIAINYFFNGFISDIISSFPYNILFEFDMNDCYQPYIPGYKYLYLLFFFRITRVNKFFQLIEREFSKLSNFIRLIKLFSVVVFIANFAGNIFCGNSATVLNKWIFSQCSDIPRSSPQYFNCLNKTSTENLGSIYFYSLFMGIIMTLGNDFTTETIYERIILFLTFVTATIINATIYGNVAVMLSHASHGVSPLLRDKIDTMNEYMSFMKFSRKFTHQVEEYHMNIWYKQRNMMYDESFFDDMSMALRKSLLIQQWKNTFLVYSKFLPVVSERFILDMVVLLKPRIFMTHDIIITEGENTTEVYFTSTNGNCKVYIGGQWVKDINKGDYFGEISTFLRSRRRTATVYSMSTSDILILDGKSFELLLRNYPTDHDKIKRVAVKTFIESMKFYPSSLFAKLVPTNNVKDYLFRKRIYLDNEEEDNLLNEDSNLEIDKIEYEQKIRYLKEKLESIKTKLEHINN